MSAAFLKILNMSMTASWLILAVIAARKLLKTAPKWISCLLWGMVAVRLICPVSFESIFSLVPSSEPIPAGIAYQASPSVNTGISIVNDVVNPALSASFTPGPGDSANPLQIVIPIAAAIWIAGILILSVYAVISCMKLRKTVAVCLPAGGNVFTCDEINTPFILGVFRPQIYVPSSMKGEMLEQVLLHENAHLQRHDHWWKPLGFLLVSVYWFNPLCWIAYILLCRDIEMACDEKVIREMDVPARTAYSQAILDCSFSRRQIAACPLAFGEVGVKERVKGVLHYRRPTFWLIFAAVIICLVVAVCFLTNPKSEEQDLSFLNYKNAITLIGQNGTDYVINYPPGTSEIQVGNVDDRELIQFLENCNWTKRRFSPQNLSSPGSLQFVIEEGYRITVYQSPKVASVQFEEQTRYYSTGSGDYETAMALFHTAASTEPAVNSQAPQYRTEFIGNAPEVVAIAGHLPYPGDYTYGHIEIQSDHEPYELTVYLNGTEGFGESEFEEVSQLAFEQIGNMGGIRFCREENGEVIAVFSRPVLADPDEKTQAQANDLTEYQGKNAKMSVDDASVAADTENQKGVLVPYAPTQDGQWEADGKLYRFCLVLEGRMNNARVDTTFTVLSNDKDITFEDVAEKLFSSQSHTAFDDKDAVLVKWESDTKEQNAEAAEVELAEETGTEGGRWLWPLEKTHEIGDSFGTRVHPFTGEERMHDHVNLRAEEDENVVSAVGGIIKDIQYDPQMGITVTIDLGDGIEIEYGHLSRVEVSDVGAAVQTGDLIGTAGATGMTTGINLSFKVTINGTPVDPLQFFE